MLFDVSRLRHSFNHKSKDTLEILQSALISMAAAWPFPDKWLEKFAFVANAGQNERAPLLWRRLIERHPDWVLGHAGLAGGLRGLRRYDEAGQVLRSALEKFPGDSTLTIEAAWLALDTNEVDQALELWKTSASMSPDRADCMAGWATALRRMLKFDEADAVLKAAMDKFPRACFVYANYAVTADSSGDREEALRRWQNVLERFPREPIGYAGLGAALKMLNRFSEADEVLREGMRRFPLNANIAINHAWVAVMAGDWREAMRRWTKLRARWPRNSLIQACYSETEHQALLAAVDDEEEPNVSPAANVERAGAADDLSKFVSMFESIGENCELGFVQRHFGAEPLSLFRWSGIAYPALLDALQSDFAGIGEADQTTLNVNPNNREYFTEDRRFGMSMHTFVLESNEAPDSIKKKMCRRLKYLKEKLVEDLNAAAKIFVFNTAQPLSDEELDRLHGMMKKYGPVSLLHVAPHADIPPGQVIEVAPMLWRASLGKTGYDGKVWDIEYDTWRVICNAMRAYAPAGV